MRGRSIIKNSIYNVIYKVINVFFSLAASIVIARILLPSGVGKISSAQNIVTYFTFAASLGLPNYGTREIAKQNKTSGNVLFTELFIMNSISTILCIFIYYTMIYNINFFSGEQRLHAVAGIAIVLNLFNVDWYYQGREEFKYIAIRNCIVKIIMFATIVICVRKSSDYLKYVLIYCMGIAGNNILNVAHLKKYGVRFSFQNINLAKHLQPILILFASNIAVELFSLLDTTMLTLMCSDEVVGYYSNAMKIMRVSVPLITAVGGVLLPRISYYLNLKKEKEASQLIYAVFKAIFFLAIPCMLGMYSVADLLVIALFGQAFSPAIVTVKILAVLLLVVTYSNSIGIQVLIAMGEERKVLLSTSLGAIANIILNSILIKLYAQNGAAIASVISETTVTLTMLFFERKFFIGKIKWRFWLSVAMASVSMLFMLHLVRYLQIGDFALLIISIFIAVVTYITVGFYAVKDIYNSLRNSG